MGGIDRQKLDADIAKVLAETIKIGVETRKINKEVRWFEATFAVAATLATVAVVKLFL